MSSASPAPPATPLRFSSLTWHIDRAFWFKLSSLKLEVWKLDAGPQSSTASYTTPVRATDPGGLLELTAGAFDGTMSHPFPSLPRYSLLIQLLQGLVESRLTSRVPAGYAASRGSTVNFNTKEEYRTQAGAAAKLLQDNYLHLIETKAEEVLQCPALLTPFNLLCYANLKKYTFDHQLSCPTLPSKWEVLSRQPVQEGLLKAVEGYIERAPAEQRGFFTVTKVSESEFKVDVLGVLSSPDLAASIVYIGYLNPSPAEEGQPLQNLLTFIALHPTLPPSIAALQILSYRRHGLSSLLTLRQTEPLKLRIRARWETDSHGRPIVRHHDLSTAMDPKRRIAEARDLNNNLMRWRVAEGIDLDVIRRANVAILGMGTLGCGVVRTLMGWGAQKFKIVDNGIVSFSNPARQNMYTFEDCLSGEILKVNAAATAMAKIDPGVQVDAYPLTIPMPDHPASFIEQDYLAFLEIMKWADVVFLLVDTREARWLPTVVCAAYDKLVINAAVGFDSFVVMRHGLPSQKDKLGCYFCSDIVSPTNVLPTPSLPAQITLVNVFACVDVIVEAAADRQSTDNATLDQQCTVTRPGIANLASSIATELYITLLQHPLRAVAPIPASGTSEDHMGFGTTPHQIRGHLSSWEQHCLSGRASEYCAGCGDKIVRAWIVEGPAFVKKICGRGGGTEIERVCGLEEVKKEFEGGWDGGEGDEDEEWEL